jgi:hypothetical protein
MEVIMGILVQNLRPVYTTTDGKTFADGAEAADHQVRVSLVKMLEDGRFKPTPGTGGNWSWFSVREFIADNREELRILLDNVRPQQANKEDE